MLPFLSNFIIDIRKVEFPEQIQQWAKKNSVLITTPSFLKLLKKYCTNIPENIYLFFSAGSTLSNEIQNYIEEPIKLFEDSPWEKEQRAIREREKAIKFFSNLKAKGG